MTGIVKLEVFDDHQHTYTTAQIRHIDKVIDIARRMGYDIKWDDHHGWSFCSIVFPDEASAALFKLTHL
jgi:hypothetical protein